jgi:F420-0:gamma-glutamyl ligase-like protein
MRYQSIGGRAAFLAGMLAVAISGCDFASITGAYRGPMPAKVGLVAEEVIVRRIESEGRHLIVDRVRFAGDPHNVNRVVSVNTSALKTQTDALNLKGGDHVVISTEFVQVGEIVDFPEVPNWPGHNAVEFPIGLHRLTAVARPAP